jgi:CDP-4-dehydro-6-deoxyglucose reductase, E1
VDIDIGTYEANIEQIREAISPKTKAIMIAHTLGNMFNVKEIKKICEEHNLWLIEDTCDAL